LRFISTASNSPNQLADPDWQRGRHNQLLKCAFEKAKNAIDANDCELATEQWLSQWTTLGDKTRGSILAGMNAILHTANTGIVRAMLSEGNNCSPDTMLERGKSVLVNFPTSDSGPTGRFICGAWKFCTQWEVLRRKPDARRFFNVIWCDEFQESCTSFDPRYLARCRSFRGCMVCLTQSIHALYGSLSGENGKSQANALLANFRYKLAHSLADHETAEMFPICWGRVFKLLLAAQAVSRGTCSTTSLVTTPTPATSRNITSRFYTPTSSWAAFVRAGMASQTPSLSAPASRFPMALTTSNAPSPERIGDEQPTATRAFCGCTPGLQHSDASH
jgi:hypothetical protein